MCKVSVIIPTFNRAKLLKRAVDSVLSQTFKDFELIIVDDGSSDNTEEVVRSCSDKRIVYKKSQHNRGVSHARNIGILCSKGDYIALLDSDDEWFPYKLEKQLECFKKTKFDNTGIVGCKRLNVDKKGNVLHLSDRVYVGNVLIALLDGWMKSYGVMNSSIALIKKDVFDTVGVFDEKLTNYEDYDMWVRIAQKYSFDAVSSSLARCYRWKEEPRVADEKSFLCAAHFLEKNKNVFKKEKCIYARKLLWIGNFAMQLCKKRDARRYFLESIKSNLFSFNSLIVFIVFSMTFFCCCFYVSLYKLYNYFLGLVKKI